MRSALIGSVCTGLSLAACGRSAPQGAASMDVAEHIISLERAALDRWIRAEYWTGAEMVL